MGVMRFSIDMILLTENAQTPPLDDINPEKEKTHPDIK
jgi:hypothetical protein